METAIVIKTIIKNNGGKLPSTGGTPSSIIAVIGTLTSLLGASIIGKRKIK